MISLFCRSYVQFYYTKFYDLPLEDRQVLIFGFVNQFVDSDDEDDEIFESERSFSGVFNTFVKQWCVKKDKNIFKFASTITHKTFETNSSFHVK